VAIDVKDLLYSAINEIGSEKIRMDIAADVDACEKYCIEIINKCKIRLESEANDETLATLCEALLHFMLTASLLPSERKVGVQGADLDVVIPSSRILIKSPQKSLVIQIIRENDLAAKIKQAESVEPYRENIWLVSVKELKTDHRNYHLDPINRYSHIIPDISKFLLEKGNRGLRLLQ
jgi:hypothetical protein